MNFVEQLAVSSLGDGGVSFVVFQKIRLRVYVGPVC